MGMSETVRAGMDLAKGGNPLNSIENAATFGGKDMVGGALTPKMPNMPSASDAGNAGQFPDTVKAAAAAAASDDKEDPLARIRRRASTLLTGGLGVTDNAPVQRKTLLGQ